LQQGDQEQIMTMRLGILTKTGLAAATLSLLAQPVMADNRDRSKRTESATPANEACKPAVRSMSESTPSRRNDCPKVRRILM
jgi:hypothetical protein